MAKQIIYDGKARRALEKGMDILALAIRNRGYTSKTCGGRFFQNCPFFLATLSYFH
jgi:hypothetical protein